MPAQRVYTGIPLTVTDGRSYPHVSSNEYRYVYHSMLQVEGVFLVVRVYMEYTGCVSYLYHCHPSNAVYNNRHYHDSSLYSLPRKRRTP